MSSLGFNRDSMAGHCCSAYMEVDLDAIRHNLDTLLRHIGPGCALIPVVKANAYGLGDVRIARLLTEEYHVGLLAVSGVFEAVKLRRAGFDKVSILSMSGAQPHAVSAAVAHDVQPALFSEEAALALSVEARKQGRGRVQAQIKIETGFNRVGVKPGEALERLLRRISDAGNIEITGVFTHYATATESGNPFAYAQLARFNEGLAQVRAAGIEPRYVHTCNSGTVSWLPEAYFSHVRVGCLIYGYLAMDDYSYPFDLREAASFRAYVNCISRLQPGDSVGYGRYFVADRVTDVASVGAGYADGVCLPLAKNNGPVYVNETKARYLGVCMDQLFVDVTGIACNPGDEVTLFGRTKGGKLFSVFELERLTGNTFYTFLTATASERVARVYLGGGG